MTPDVIAAFLTWYIALLVSLVFHEASHAFVALLGGDRTAYEAGQVTVNPLPHIRREPFGTVVLPILTFYYMGWPLGFAHAPYSPYWAEAHPKRAAVMSAAGPAANLVFAALLFAVMKVGLGAGWFELPYPRPTYAIDVLEQLVVASGGQDEGGTAAIAKICSVMFSMNMILGLFNLIPLPPLDGAGIAEGALPGPFSAFYRLLRTNSVFVIAGMLAAWQIAPYVVFPPFLWARDILWG